MKRGQRLVLTVAFCLLNAGNRPLHAGKLDIDIYSRTPMPPQAKSAGHRLEQIRLPGDPRSLRGESRLVRRVSHTGYAILGIAGLAGSVATGGVGPAIGFGIVALIHGLGLLQTGDNPAQPPQPMRAEGNNS